MEIGHVDLKDLLAILGVIAVAVAVWHGLPVLIPAVLTAFVLGSILTKDSV